MADFTFLNPLSKYFLKGKQEKSRYNEIQTTLNAQGLSEDDQLYDYNTTITTPDGTAEGSFYSAPIHFTQIFQSKKSRIIKYREMEMYPEISEALDVICDDAIVEDKNGHILHLDFNRELTASDERILRKEFDYVINDVIKVKERLWDFFRKFLVEGELFLELVINNDKNKIIGVKPLATFNTFPVYKGNIITNFVQGNEGILNSQVDVNISTETKEDVFFPAQQVAYINWGKFGISKQDVRGFLEAAIRTYNQLKNLEDAIVVYRLVRAPERRVWNIEVGRMPKGKAEEYLRKLITNYKKQLNYNPETGAIDSAQNVQSMTEDFWFAKNEGQGSSVESLPSGAALGELEDLKYFLNKLYKVLKLPKNRIDGSGSQYNSGKSIERDEVKFGKFIDRIQGRFKKIIMDVFIEHIRLNPDYSKFIDRSIFDVQFNKSNDFKDYKEMELLESKINIWSSLSNFIASPERPDEVFSREFAFKYLVQWSDEMWDLNNGLKKKEVDSFPERVNVEELNPDATAGNTQDNDSSYTTSES